MIIQNLLTEQINFWVCNWMNTYHIRSKIISNFIIKWAKHPQLQASLKTLLYYYAMIHPHLLNCTLSMHALPPAIYPCLKNIPAKPTQYSCHSTHHKYNLISLLNTWMTNGQRQNDNHDFRNSDDLYTKTEQATLLCTPNYLEQFAEQRYTCNPAHLK